MRSSTAAVGMSFSSAAEFRFRSRRPVTSPAPSSFRHPRLGPQSSLLRLSHQWASFPPPLLTAAGRRQPSVVATNSRSTPNHRLQQQIRSRTPPVSICKKDQQWVVICEVPRINGNLRFSQGLVWILIHSILQFSQNCHVIR
ncbi:hypothetical protein EJB05_00367 [Eragrostis curvula]|uniref:Uncharacterized protein n=1 Tax=Eragrostis curvula TaxID=38414 RepID=A0A5J9WMB1_9POAL|nr:hypothetical protein EJB05_00367 [Eragrostis curvula]